MARSRKREKTCDWIFSALKFRVSGLFVSVRPEREHQKNKKVQKNSKLIMTTKKNNNQIDNNIEGIIMRVCFLPTSDICLTFGSFPN